MRHTMERHPDRDFDVGPNGLTGHYDIMIKEFREHTASGLLALVVWVWVLFWPRPTVIFQFAADFTAMWIVWGVLLIWTAPPLWRLLVGTYYYARWIELEKRGLFRFVENEQLFRYESYSFAKGKAFADWTTQDARSAQENSTVHRRRARLVSEGVELAKALIWLVPVPVTLIWVIPTFWDDAFVATVRHYANIDALASYLNTDAPTYLKAFAPTVSHWLMRPDVHGIVAPLTIDGLAELYVFFKIVVPALSNLGWTAWEWHVHRRGFQYVPGAQVLEESLVRKTLESAKKQLTYGGTKLVGGYQAAEDLAR